MKRGTPRHPKVDDLAQRLGIPKYSAVGILELLWHFTAEFALAGDVGRFSDEVIARAVCWDDASMMLGSSQDRTIKKNDAASWLISCLVEAGWIDKCDCHRLRVHDWNEHADQTVERVLAKRGQRFLKCYDDARMKLGSCEDETSLPLPLPKANTIANTCTKNSRKNARGSKKSVSPKNGQEPERGTDHHLFIALWCEKFKNHFGTEYDFQGGRDGKAVAQIVASAKVPIPEIIDLAEKAWSLQGFPGQRAAAIHSFHAERAAIIQALKNHQTNGRHPTNLRASREQPEPAIDIPIL